jgi:hypothetical protein
VVALVAKRDSSCFDVIPTSARSQEAGVQKFQMQTLTLSVELWTVFEEETLVRKKDC